MTMISIRRPPYSSAARCALFAQMLVILADWAISRCPHLTPFLSRINQSSQANNPSPYVGYQNQPRSQESPGAYGGYYGNRNGHGRPDSYYDSAGAPPNPNGRRVGVVPRNHSDPALYGHNGNQGIYPLHGQQASYDTVGSASNGSHATDQWGNSTDPSSENSSIDRVQATTKPDLGEAYGFNGFGGAPQFQGPILEEHGQGSPAYGQPGYGRAPAANGNGNGYPYRGNGSAPPPPPHKDDRPPRVPVKLGAPAPGARRQLPVGNRPPPPVAPEKRRSWLKRTFSRGS